MGLPAGLGPSRALGSMRVSMPRVWAAGRWGPRGRERAWAAVWRARWAGSSWTAGEVGWRCSAGWVSVAARRVGETREGDGWGGVLVAVKVVVSVTIAVGAVAAVGEVVTRWRARVRTAATREGVMRVVLDA